MEIIFLGTGAPLHVSRATTGMLIRADGGAPLLVDTCGGFELARGLSSTGFHLRRSAMSLSPTGTSITQEG